MAAPSPLRSLLPAPAEGTALSSTRERSGPAVFARDAVILWALGLLAAGELALETRTSARGFPTLLFGAPTLAAPTGDGEFGPPCRFPPGRGERREPRRRARPVRRRLPDRRRLRRVLGHRDRHGPLPRPVAPGEPRAPRPLAQGAWIPDAPAHLPVELAPRRPPHPPRRQPGPSAAHPVQSDDVHGPWGAVARVSGQRPALGGLPRPPPLMFSRGADRRPASTRRRPARSSWSGRSASTTSSAAGSCSGSRPWVSAASGSKVCRRGVRARTPARRRCSCSRSWPPCPSRRGISRAAPRRDSPMASPRRCRVRSTLRGSSCGAARPWTPPRSSTSSSERGSGGRP